MAKLILDNGQAKSAVERAVSRMLEQAGINEAFVTDWELESDGGAVRLVAKTRMKILLSEFQALLEEAAGHG